MSEKTLREAAEDLIRVWHNTEPGITIAAISEQLARVSTALADSADARLSDDMPYPPGHELDSVSTPIPFDSADAPEVEPVAWRLQTIGRSGKRYGWLYYDKIPKDDGWLPESVDHYELQPLYLDAQQEEG